VDQPGLADAGLAHQGDDLPSAALCVFEAIPQKAKLLRSTDERRKSALHGYVEASTA